MASSCTRWWPSTHIILPAEASGPGSSPLRSLVMARAPVYLNTSVSIHICASFCRMTGSWVAGTPFFVVLAREIHQAVERDAQAHLEPEARAPGART